MNITQIRKDTAGCEDKLFVNSAGSSLMPKKVVESIHHYLQQEEHLGGYTLADSQALAIEDFYQQAAQLIHAEAHQIAFAFSATEAYAKALSSIHFAAHDVILTTDDDYVSNQINFIALQQRFKIKIVRSKNLANGDIDLENFEALILKHRPKLVAITHIPTNSGLVQDVEKIGDLCEKHQVVYLLDACQSVGQIEVDVQKIKCDFMSVTGRKFLRGPRGTGFLYVSDKMLQENYAPLFIDLRGAQWTSADDFQMINTAQRFETWELPYALLIGLKEAVKYALEMGMDNIEQYNQRISSHLRARLTNMPDIRMYDQGTRTSNIITFQKEGKSLDQIKAQLDAHHVFYSSSGRNSATIDFDKKGIDWVVRLSPHYFNTMEEMDRLGDIIAHI